MTKENYTQEGAHEPHQLPQRQRVAIAYVSCGVRQFYEASPMYRGTRVPIEPLVCPSLQPLQQSDHPPPQPEILTALAYYTSACQHNVGITTRGEGKGYANVVGCRTPVSSVSRV